MARLLVVEDDESVRQLAARALQREGYQVDVACDGEEGLVQTDERLPDLIVLDWMLPKVSGIEVCRRLRGRPETRNVPIIMLTARGEETDRVRGLDVGADDYLTKPFAFDELLARMQALLRRGRYHAAGAPTLRVADLTLDPATRKVARASRQISLTAREFALLSYLMANAGKVISRTKLLANVWEYGFDPGTKIVDVYIRYLRKKLSDEGASIIQTVRGVGYMIPAG